MAEGEKVSQDKTEVTHLVEEVKKGVSVRLVLVYILLLSTGLFIGILFAYLIR